MKRLWLFAAMLSLGACSAWRGAKVEPPAPVPTFKATLAVKEIWDAGVGTGAGRQFLDLVPFVGGARIYVSDRTGRVSAYNPKSGSRVWRTDLAQPITASVGHAPGLVLVGTAKGKVIALGRDDGKPRWQTQVSSQVLAPPVGSGAYVIAQSGDGAVTALAAADGKILWRQERQEPPLTLRGTGTPAIVGNTVIAGLGNGKLVAFDLGDGRTLWETTVAEPHGRNEIERLIDVDTPPLKVGDNVYAAAYQGRVVAVNADSGRLVWAREASTYLPLAADAHNLYLTDAHGVVYAFDLQTGAVAWKQDALLRRRVTGPAVVGGDVVVGDYEGQVYWIDAADGHFVGRYHTEDNAIKAPPATGGDDTVYVLNDDGDLYALRAH